MSRKKKRKKGAARKSLATAQTKAAPVSPQETDNAKEPGKTNEAPSRPKETGAAAILFGGVAPSRIQLLLRLTLLLLAFDCWIDLIPHGGRYGVGEFNVAHFAILDVLLPMPTPGLYVGSLLFTGVLAFAMAIAPWRPGLVILFITYTLGWAMSMLDSYQHHYLVSLVLFSFMFLPLPEDAKKAKAPESDPLVVRLGGLAFAWGLADLLATSSGVAESSSLRAGMQGALLLYGILSMTMLREKKTGGAQDPREPLVNGWAYVSVCVTCAIVYFYTAVNKLSPDWRDGHALRRLGHSDAFQELQASAAEGLAFLPPLEGDEFWSLMAKGAIAVQLLSAIAFLVASQQDRLTLRWPGRVALIAFGLAPLSFHLGTEAMGLEIGWFSFYMLTIVVVVFTPREILDAAVSAIGVPARAFLDALPRSKAAGALVIAAAAVCALLLATLDLPGGPAAGLLLTVIGGFAASEAMREKDGTHALLGLGLLLAGVAAYVSVTQTSVRYDYYRFVGGDHRRRGEPEEALAAYIKANAYVVTPYCVIAEGHERDCYRSEEAAERAAQGVEGGHVERVDRQEKEDEMRRIVEARAAEGS